MKEWQDMKEAEGKDWKYVENKTDFDNVDPAETDYLLGT